MNAPDSNCRFIAGLPRMPRRTFLRACARYPLLGGLALLGGWLAWRRADPTAPVPCIKRRVCRDCRLFSGCTLPQAVATRRAS